MAKVIMIHADKCTGCRNCELACSFIQEGAFRPLLARVHAYSWEREGVSVPMMCQHCEDAPCITVCPTGAMHRNKATDTVDWNSTTCIKCRMCTIACPFGNAVYDSQTNRIIKCNMCNGDPECVRFCPSEALTYAEGTVAVRSRKKAYAAKFKEAFKEAS
ncbi:MAG: 4Fe-4S dicluster domain-containing protein [Acidobacteriota bacterium]